MPHRRKTILAVVLAAVSIGGFGVAVAASGQSTTQGSYTVGDYTTTTPTTPATVPAAPTVTAQDETGGGSQTSTSTSGGSGSRPTPSTATRRGPSHLAFTGAEPLLIGGVGVALMLAGVLLHRRRRATA